MTRVPKSENRFSLDYNKLLGNLGNMLQFAVIVPDVYEMALYALCFASGGSGAFVSVDGKTQYFDAVVGSYHFKRHSIKSGVHVWAYDIPEEAGQLVQSQGVWLYKTHASNWLFGIDVKTPPDSQFIESVNAVSLGAIGFVRNNEKLILGKDKLTGLWDRGSFYRDLKHMAKIATKNNTPLALAFLDLNNFKTVNDILGHSYGDRILCSQAAKLQRAISDGGTSYRWGGDEFVGIITGQTEPQLLELARRIEASSEESPGGIKVSASVGITMYTPGENIDTLIDRSDNAMFEAKRAYKERIKEMEQSASLQQ